VLAKGRKGTAELLRIIADENLRLIIEIIRADGANTLRSIAVVDSSLLAGANGIHPRSQTYFLAPSDPFYRREIPDAIPPGHSRVLIRFA
jgi:hypothetical protein